MAIEEGELLSAVGRIVGGVEIDRDPRDLALQASAVPLDHGLGQCDPHPVQIRTIQGILEARERRLGGEILATDRVATAQQLLDRVGRESARIIAIRVATGDRVETLTHQRPDRMADLARLAPVIDAANQRLGQTHAPIAGFKQERAAIGTGMRLVELRHHRAAEQIRKQDTLSCGIVVHAKAS